ncbi:MAG: hypothetical protein ACREJX_04540, partial [Polyangiaceae bacterium]
MTPQSLVRLFVGYAIVLVLVCEAIILRYSLHSTGAAGPIIASVWSKGELVARALVTDGRGTTAEIDKAMETPGAMRTNEIVTSTSPLVTWTEPAFAISLVAARDGVKVTYDGKVDYVTPDELLSQRGYDHGIQDDALGVSFGTDVQLVVALAAQR